MNKQQLLTFLKIGRRNVLLGVNQIGKCFVFRVMSKDMCVEHSVFMNETGLINTYIKLH